MPLQIIKLILKYGNYPSVLALEVCKEKLGSSFWFSKIGMEEILKGMPRY